MKNVLVVDDEMSIRNIVESILLSNGYRCVPACSADQARKFLSEQTFNLVISDIQMPGESGLDLIKFVRSEYPETATVIITVMDSNEAAKEALAVGASGYLIKPFRQSELLFCVKHTLRRSELENSNKAYQALVDKVVSRQTIDMPTPDVSQAAEKTMAIDTVGRSNKDKMAVVGQLAAGVANEINAPLGFIGLNLNKLQEYCSGLNKWIEQNQGLVAKHKTESSLKERSGAVQGNTEADTRPEFISELDQEIDPDFILSDISDLVKDSLDGAERIRAIVADLKDFAQPCEQQAEAVNLNQCIDDTLNIVRNELSYKAEVVKTYDELPEIRCVQNQIKQVLMNLLVNAAQAIEDRGEIEITTQNSNGWAEVTISDTGDGIDPDNLENIFRPFFTTKVIGKGTGLGLHLSDKIIREHGGTISVSSRPGAGSSFTVRIPIEPNTE